MSAWWNCKYCSYLSSGPICAKCGWVPKFGDLPSRVGLCAIGYHMTCVEGVVLFSAERGIAGCFTRLSFTRNCGCWYMELIDSDDKVMVAHVEEAYELVKLWFGDNHDFPRGENNP